MSRVLGALLLVCISFSVVFAQGMANYDIYQGGRKVGSSEFEFIKVGDHLQLRATTELDEAGKKVEYLEEGLFNSRMQPQSYRLSIKEPASMSSVNAEFHGGKVEVSISAGAEATKKTLDFDQNGFVILQQTPVGIWTIIQNYDFSFLGGARVPVFMPMSQEVGELVLNKTGEEKVDGDRYYVIEGELGDIKSIMSVRREDGIPVRVEYPATKIEMRLVEKPTWAKEEPTRTRQSAATGKYTVVSPSIIANEDMLKKLRGYKELSFTMSMDASAFLDRVYLNNRMQEFSGTIGEGGRLQGKVEVEKRRYRVTGAPEWPPIYPLRVDKVYLKPAPGIDSEDPAIKDRARRTVAPTRRLWDAVRAINLWVFLNVEYTEDSFGGKEAFVNLRGDSRSKALVAISLCRSIDIPARLVGGLIYDGNSFVDHYWFEVFLGQAIGWAPLDPTLNDVDDISAAHVSLFVGSEDIPITVKDIQIQDIRAK